MGIALPLIGRPLRTNGSGPNGGGKQPIRCRLLPPNFQLADQDLARLLADPQVRAKGWDKDRIWAYASSILPLHRKFSAVAPQVEPRYFISNREEKFPVIGCCTHSPLNKAIDILELELILLSPENSVKTAKISLGHLGGAMARYLRMQENKYIEAELDGAAQERIYTHLLRESREDIAALLNTAQVRRELVETPLRFMHAAILENADFVLEIGILRQLLDPLPFPVEFIEGALKERSASFDRALMEMLQRVKPNLIVFFTPRMVEPAAYAAIAEFCGHPQIAEQMRQAVCRSLESFIPAYLVHAFPHLMNKLLALPALQARILGHSLYAFDEVKQIYLSFLRSVRIKMV